MKILVTLFIAIFAGFIMVNCAPKEKDKRMSLNQFLAMKNHSVNPKRRVERQVTPVVVANSSDTTAVPVVIVTETPAPTAAPVTSYSGTAGYACSSEFFKNYASKCCRLPPIVEESMIARCSGGPRIPFAISQLSGRGGRQRVKLQFTQYVHKNAKGTITTEQICLTDCIFRSQRWIQPDNTIDYFYVLNALSTVYATLTNLFTTAASDCYSVISTGDITANVTGPNGRKCLLNPSKFLRCIRRYMMKNCPPEHKPSIPTRQCTLDAFQLDKCDPNIL